jgi:8-oxo-dGTP diphosphatase
MAYALYEVKVMMFLKNEKGEYLFMNNNHKDSIIFGYINPPAGHIEPGESFQETVKREAMEEIGITDIKNIQLRGSANVVGFKNNPILMLIVTGEVSSNTKLETKEEGEPVWVGKNEYSRYKMLRDIKQFVDLLENEKEGSHFSVTSKFELKELVEFTIN